MSKSDKTNSRNWRLSYTSVVNAAGSVYRFDKSNNVKKIDGTVCGDNNPNWRQLIASGQDCTTSLTGVKRHLQRGAGNAHFRAKYDDSYNGTAYGNLGSLILIDGFAPVVNSVSSYADKKAKGKFLQSYISAQNTWRGGNFVAELRETWHALKHPIESFYKRTWSFAGTVKKIGKVYKRDPLRYQKALGDAWLAFSFGVKPLSEDIKDAAAALNELRTGTRHDTRPVKGNGFEQSVPIDRITTASVPYFPTSFQAEYTLKVTSRVRYKGACVIQADSTGTPAREFGMDVFDVVPAVWEAIPWSFFIDYFTNVGELLDSLRYLNARFAYCVRTVRNSSVASVKNFAPISAPGYEHDISGGMAHYVTTYVHRNASGIPFPDFHFRVPGLESGKWLNIAALTAQILDSKPFRR